MRILGIDPGLRITGYGCVEATTHGATLIEAGVLRLDREKGRSVSERLVELHADLRTLIERIGPAAVAVESLFAHYKHPATAIAMGHARGVILLAVQHAGLELIELKPNMVKKSLTGNGHAAKDQIQRSIQEVFNLSAPPSPPDIADALAIALCASHRVTRAL